MEGHQLADGRAQNGALRLSADSHGRVEGVEPGRKSDIGTITLYNVYIYMYDLYVYVDIFIYIYI